MGFWNIFKKRAGQSAPTTKMSKANAMMTKEESESEKIMSMVCFYCGETISEKDHVCPKCGTEQSTESMRRVLKGDHKFYYMKDDRHCPRCGRNYIDGDAAFCVYCGEKRQFGREAKYKVPFPDEMVCLYGPKPETITFQCSGCGKKYRWSNWNTDRKYCPACGAELIVSPGWLQF